MNAQILTLIAITVIIIGIGMQIFKITTRGSSEGVSFNSYIAITTSAFALLLNAEQENVYYIAYAEIIMCTLAMLTINKYNDSNSKEKKGLYFWASIGLSILMIKGLIQSLKSFQHKGYSSVSVVSYSLYLLFNGLLISIATNTNILIALYINACVFSYIVIDTILKNIKYKP